MLAISPGTVTFNDNGGSAVRFAAVRSSDNITHNCTNIGISGFSGAPLAVASQNHRDGGDGGWLHRCSVSASNVQVMVQEDVAADSDTAHTTERAGLAAFSQAFDASPGAGGTTLGNYTGGLPAQTVTGPVGPTSLTDGRSLSNNGLVLSIPGAGNTGTVDLTLDVPAWLEYPWAGGADYRPDGYRDVWPVSRPRPGGVLARAQQLSRRLAGTRTC